MSTSPNPENLERAAAYAKAALQYVLDNNDKRRALALLLGLRETLRALADIDPARFAGLLDFATMGADTIRTAAASTYYKGQFAKYEKEITRAAATILYPSASFEPARDDRDERGTNEEPTPTATPSQLVNPSRAEASTMGTTEAPGLFPDLGHVTAF